MRRGGRGGDHRARPAITAGVRRGPALRAVQSQSLIVFTSVIPQFLPAHPPAAEVALFALLFAVRGFISLSIYAAALAATRRAGAAASPTAAARQRRGAIAFGIDLVADLPA